MATKANFVAVTLNNGKLFAKGESDPKDRPDELQVIVIQEADGAGNPGTYVSGSSKSPGTKWTVELDGKGFKRRRSAVAFGIEIRRKPATVLTWTQGVKID